MAAAKTDASTFREAEYAATHGSVSNTIRCHRLQMERTYWSRIELSKTRMLLTNAFAMYYQLPWNKSPNTYLLNVAENQNIWSKHNRTECRTGRTAWYRPFYCASNKRCVHFVVVDAPAIVVPLRPRWHKFVGTKMPEHQVRGYRSDSLRRGN